MSKSSLFRSILVKTAQFFLAPIIICYIVFPLLFLIFPYFMQHIIFLNFVNNPFTQYSNLELHGVESVGRNFYLTQEGNIKIGAWHILPKSLSKKHQNEDLTKFDFEKLLNSGNKNIILYIHGNTFSRSSPHRVALYNLLSELDYHIVAIDVRGYGDSEGRPTEKGVVADTLLFYKYLIDLAPNRVYFWGHSLGTGISLASLSEATKLNLPAPQGLILESPFNCLRDVVLSHPFSKPFRWIPYIEYIIVDSLKSSGLVFDSDISITHLTCPILIIHAEDDHVIPSTLGEQLYLAAKDAGKDVKFHLFQASHEFRHKHIHRSNLLPQLVKTFIEKN
uniref:Lysophosphatidylserine lipase ABHD12 n=1 Tax=Rhabditophanes sp. KR3021 TaxID=114890 RepID=A0AC35UG10_9BILA